MRSKPTIDRISAREACRLTQLDEGCRRSWKRKGILLQQGDRCDETDTIELNVVRKLFDVANSAVGRQIWADIGPGTLGIPATCDQVVALWNRTEGSATLLRSGQGGVQVIRIRPQHDEVQDEAVKTVASAEALLSEFAAADGHNILVISLGAEIRTARERFRNRLPDQWRRASEAKRTPVEEAPSGGN